MEIIIKPRKLKGSEYWEHKMHGVVLVEKEEDIGKLFNLLMDQDDYWEGYKHLIKVAPKEIDSEKDIEELCEYTGKTSIYPIKKFQEVVPFIIYQYKPEGC